MAAPAAENAAATAQNALFVRFFADRHLAERSASLTLRLITFPSHPQAASPKRMVVVPSANSGAWRPPVDPYSLCKKRANCMVSPQNNSGWNSVRLVVTTLALAWLALPPNTSMAQTRALGDWVRGRQG